ncbi:MAG: hypothetical protein WC657_07995, partial [Candidatus Paceibacterota bacterium]
VVSSNYTFPSTGSYSVRACADNNASMVGVITESNEGDNCGAWTTITVSAAATAVANIKANGSDGPINIAYNGLADITWTSTNATSCTVTPPNWTGTSALAGSHNINLISTTIYTISCLPVGPASSDTVTVNVPAQPKNITVIKTGQGTITSSPAGISCGTGCSSQAATFAANINVVFTATPATGRIFTGWVVQGGGSCGGTGTCTVLTDANKTIIANFAVDPNYKEF